MDTITNFHTSLRIVNGNYILLYNLKRSFDSFYKITTSIKSEQGKEYAKGKNQLKSCLIILR